MAWYHQNCQAVHTLYIVQLILLFVKFTIASLNRSLLAKLKKRTYQVLNYKCDQWRRKKGKHFTSMSAKLERYKKKVLWEPASWKPRKYNMHCWSHKLQVLIFLKYLVVHIANIHNMKHCQPLKIFKWADFLIIYSFSELEQVASVWIYELNFNYFT